MKNKLKDDWIPKWQQNWNKLPRAKGQMTRGVREHPKPSFPPDLPNYDRMIIRAETRKIYEDKARELKNVSPS